MRRCHPGHDFQAEREQAAVAPAGQLLVRRGRAGSLECETGGGRKVKSEVGFRMREGWGEKCEKSQL